MTSLLLIDSDAPATRALFRFRTAFSQRNGIYTDIERLRLRFPGARIYYYHPDRRLELRLAQIDGLHAVRAPASPYADCTLAQLAAHGDFAFQLRSEDASPIDALDRIGERIETDLEFWPGAAPAERLDPAQLRAEGVHCLGDPGQIWIRASARILPGSVIDARNGPVVVDAGAAISPFSYLQGPLYIGPDACADDARLGGGTILGRAVRVGGEVENSLIDDYSNKHHEGFVGHSIIGRWVNLGALSTTSDLKNNYGEIRLSVPADRAAARGAGPSPLLSIATGRIKLGAIIGDCVKTAIGTLINTGSVLDAGANVFGGPPPKYLAPLAWGLGGERYDPDRFLADCRKIFARRKQEPHPDLEPLVRELLQRDD